MLPPETPKRQPPVRIRIDLPADVAAALTRLAIREDRAADRQAVRLIADALRREGVLEPELAR